MDFSEAEEKFGELQLRIQRGESLTDEQYDEEMAKLMVQDDTGTFWSLEPGTGRWLYFDGAEWKPGTPPKPAARPAPPPPSPSFTELAPISFTPDPALSKPPEAVQPPLDAESVPTYVRESEPPAPAQERPGGIPPRPVRESVYQMGMDERPWLPFAIGAVVLLLCAIVLFFGVRTGIPFLTTAAARVTSTPAPTDEPTLEEEVPTEEPTVAEEAPTDAPQPTATKATAGVSATANENVRARSGPGTGYGVLTTIAKGTNANVVGRNAESSWYQIQIPGGTSTGWVSAEFVTLTGDKNSVQVVEAPAPAGPQPSATPTKKVSPSKTPKPSATPTSTG